MNRTARTSLALGLCVILFAVLLLGVWIPLDVDTGIVEKVRRQVTIGDALAPSVAAAFLLVGGVLLVVFERHGDDREVARKLDKRAVRFVFAALGIVAVSLLIIRYAGPAAVEIRNAIADQPVEYRLLRTTAPWKWIGFILGGWSLVAGLTSLVETRLTWRTGLVALAAVLLLIAMFDLPFDDLLLPPNGDV